MFKRQILLVAFIVAAGLVRAERGAEELQGRAGEPVHVLRLFPVERGWEISVLGFETTVPTHIVLFDTGGPLLPGPAIWKTARNR